MELLRAGLIQYLIVLVSIVLHEWGHAFMADRVGDPLPRMQGRVTLNPVAHIDLLGTVLIPLIPLLIAVSGGAMGFALIGWGKPVQISLPNPKTRVRDDILITAAGPGVNVVLALLCSIAIGLSVRFAPQFVDLFALGLIINIGLAVFNLIPIPPLDGSHFARHAVRMSDETYYNLARYGGIILLILINWRAFRELMHYAITLAATPFAELARLVAGL